MSERLTARATIRELWRTKTAGVPSFDMKTIGGEIRAELLGDPAFCRSFAELFIDQVVYDIGHVMFSQDRAAVRAGSMVMTPTALREQIKGEIAASSVFAKYIVAHKESNVRVQLPEATKEHLLDIGRLRIGGGMNDLVEGHWFLLIAGRMESGQQVKEVWRDDELKRLRDSVEVKVKVNLKGVKQPTAQAAD